MENILFNDSNEKIESDFSIFDCSRKEDYSQSSQNDFNKSKDDLFQKKSLVFDREENFQIFYNFDEKNSKNKKIDFFKSLKEKKK